MAIEFPNAIEAAGLFNGVPGGLGPMLSAQGFQPFDPTGTPALPKGGFTQLSQGGYLLKLMEGIDFLEGLILSLATMTFNQGDGGLTPHKGPFMDGTLIPVAPSFAPNFPAGTQDYKSIGVVSVDDTGTLVDTQFQIVVMRQSTGPRIADLVP
jgi:hypothetical protein